MPTIKGRLDTRKNATLELVDKELKIVTGGGFFGGKPENRVIRLDEVNAIAHGTGEKPFPDAMMIKLEHPEGEVSFFSINKEPLQKIAEESEAYIEKRARLLVEMEKEFELDREAHVELLFLNLELVDALIGVIPRLQGSVDWDGVRAQYNQVIGVNQDRDNLPHMRPASLSMYKLAEVVEARSVDLIKSEVYDLLSILYQGCVEKARHQEVWFQTQLHRVFMDASLIIWNKELEGITGEAFTEDSEKIKRRFQELRHLLVDETGNEEIPLLELSMPIYDAKISLYEWVEMLQSVEFEPGEELERRLSA